MNLEHIKTKMLSEEGIEIINGSIENFDKKIIQILILFFSFDFIHQSSQVSFVPDCISAYFFV